ncbi:hypothetical protein VrSk94_33720 [Vibrio rotiferianus]
MKTTFITILILLSLVGCQKSPQFIDYFPDTGISFAGHMLGHELELTYHKDGSLTHDGIEYKKKGFFGIKWLEFDLSKTNSALVRSGLTEGVVTYVIEADQQYELALRYEACGKNEQCKKDINQNLKDSGALIKVIPYRLSANGIMDGGVSSTAADFVEKMQKHSIYFKKTELGKYDSKDMVRYTYESNGLFYGMSVEPVKDKVYEVKVSIGVTYQPTDKSEDSRQEKHALQIEKAVEATMSKSHSSL